ncbi:MAG: hypothetical protein HXO48_04870 [Prevotella sp.]|nr:hypothetical protein [Prevotella sp.]
MRDKNKKGRNYGVVMTSNPLRAEQQMPTLFKCCIYTFHSVLILNGSGLSLLVPKKS